jgi:hypothetical protein
LSMYLLAKANVTTVTGDAFVTWLYSFSYATSDDILKKP